MKKTLLRFFLALTALITIRESAPVTAATWLNVTGNLAGMASECGNLTLLSPVPGSGAIIAGVAQRGLWTNISGTTWLPLGTGAGSDTISNRPSWIMYDPLNPAVFWESGIYNGGGIYKSVDAGTTFHRLGATTHNDYVSVDFSDPGRQTLLAGGHEQTQTVYRSTNGGQDWANVGASLPAGTKFSSNPLVLDSQTYVVNAQGWSGTTPGIYRTTNGGTSWQQVSPVEPYGAPLVASNGAIYWSNGGGLLKSTDSGATWISVGSNLHPIHPIELPDGRLASLSGNSVVASADGGATWTAVDSATLPYAPAGLIYSQARGAFFIWRWDCGSVVLPDAIMRLDFDVPPLVLAAPTGLRII